MKILIDTNLLIYAVDEDSRYCEKSREILFNPAYELYTTSKNIAEFLSVITRYAKAISIEDALSAVNDFARFITILFPDDKSFLLYKKLLMRYKAHGLAVHDVEIASIAIAHHISAIATFNAKDFDFIKEIHLVEI